MEILFPHEILFSNQRTHHVTDVAKSLIANEQLLLHVGPILEKCFEGLTVEKINVQFRSATTNSPLKEAFAAAVLFTYQDKLKSEVPKTIEAITGFHVPDEYRTIITVIFIAIAIYGILDSHSKCNTV